MGVLLGQAMQNVGALKGIGRRMAEAPAALASSIPTFGLFESSAPTAAHGNKTRSGNRRGKSRSRTARASARRSPAKRSKRTTST
jgi:hypothetical protein